MGNGQGDIVGSALALPEASSGARKLCLMQQTLGVIEQEKSPNNKSKNKIWRKKVGVTEQENSALSSKQLGVVEQEKSPNKM